MDVSPLRLQCNGIGAGLQRRNNNQSVAAGVVHLSGGYQKKKKAHPPSICWHHSSSFFVFVVYTGSTYACRRYRTNGVSFVHHDGGSYAHAQLAAAAAAAAAADWAGDPTLLQVLV